METEYDCYFYCDGICENVLSDSYGIKAECEECWVWEPREEPGGKDE